MVILLSLILTWMNVTYVHILVSPLSLQTNKIITVLLLKLTRYIWILIINKVKVDEVVYSVTIKRALVKVERTWTLTGL